MAVSWVGVCIIEIQRDKEILCNFIYLNLRFPL